MIKEYQTILALNTLYRVIFSNKGSEQLAPSIEIVGGTVDIYGSQEEPIAPPALMALTRSAFSGIDSFSVIPTFLYIVQNSGTTTSIIVSGLNVEVV